MSTPSQRSSMIEEDDEDELYQAMSGAPFAGNGILEDMELFDASRRSDEAPAARACPDTFSPSAQERSSPGSGQGSYTDTPGLSQPMAPGLSSISHPSSGAESSPRTGQVHGTDTTSVQGPQHVIFVQDDFRMNICEDPIADYQYIATSITLPMAGPSQDTNSMPKKPPLMSEEFMWSDDIMSKAPRPLPTLVPAPAAVPPVGYTYPQAPEYTCNETVDRCWTSGFVYTTLFTPSTKGLLRSRLLQTKTPPNVIPRLHEGKIIVDPIAGMIQMPGSIPFVQHTKGNPDEAVTMACAHSLASIRVLYPGIADEVENLSIQLRDTTFGKEGKDGEPPMIPIYAIPGLKRNDRSVDPKKLPPGSFDGSYNLASTKGEGEGAGVVMPAVQASTPEASERIGLVLRLLHAIQRLILPRSLSKFEYDVTEAHSELNNIISFGGLEPNGTSCQMNMSSGGFDLAHFIGEHQGSWHTDIGDDWTRWTTVTMILKLPEATGSDPGAFCLARCGLYVHEADSWIVYLVFRGNDPHSGFAPTSPPIPIDLINTVVNAAGPNRVAYVNYPSRVATTRDGSMSMTPATNFGNYGATSVTKTEQRHYSDASSTPIFGDLRAKVNRLAREAANNFQNSLAWCNIKLNVSMTSLLTGMTYEDPDVGEKHIEPPPFDLELEEAQMSRWWRFYEWHRNLCSNYLIRITKDQFRTAQANIKSGTSPAPSIPYTTLERVPMAVNVQSAPLLDPDQAPEHLVTSIVERKMLNGIVTWYLKLDNETETTVVAGLPDWFHHPLNRPKFAQFVATSQVTGVNPVTLHTVVDSDIEMEEPVGGTQDAPPRRSTCIVHASDNESDEVEYIVDSIIDINTTGSEVLWHVRWEGFGPEHDTWEDMSRNARGLLNAFNQSIGHSLSPPIAVLPPPSVSSRSTSVGSEFVPEEKTTKNSKKHPYPSEPEPEQDELDEKDETFEMDPNQMVDLEKLFDPEFRRMEAEALATTEETLNRNKHYYGPTTTTSMVETLVAQNERQTQFNDYMMFVPKSPGHTPQWTQHSAVLSLNRVIQATPVLPDITKNIAKTSILDRSLRWEMARSNMLLYAWYRETGPRLARTLVDAHRKGEGFPGVNRAHPAFAHLVHHIYSYVVAQSQDKRAAKKARRQKTDAARRIRKEAPPLHPASSFEVSKAAISHLPYNLYGLRADVTGKKHVALRLPAKRVALDNIDGIYACVKNIIQEIWSMELILPPVVSMDKALAVGKRKLDDLNLIRDRAIARGAVLQCIVDACGGDESILASSDMDGLLGSLARIFPSRIQKETKFAAQVLKTPERTLERLTDWVARRLDEYPNILVFAARAARTVHRGLLELHYGVTLSDEHFLNPDMLYDESQDAPFIAPMLAGNQQSTQAKNQYFLPPTINSLLPDPAAPYFGTIGLILRERCNEMQELRQADSILRNVLEGKHPTQGRVQFDRDQTDPARQYSEYAKLLSEALPPAQLTGGLGISRLLAYMGTGKETKPNTAKNIFPMLFKDLADCVNRFETFELANMSVLSDDFHVAPSSRAARIPGYKQTYNACIWGQASNHLLLQPVMGKGSNKRRYSIEEKFTPYFSSNVQNKWITWLGGLYGQDPATYQGKKNSWASALRFILDLRVLGFQSGLTPLQFTNNLVFLGICNAPDPYEVANWIASNKSLGAYNGLLRLGFALTGYASIVITYMVVYNHLETYLSADDKQRLGFGTLFVEHLLCKVGRWEYRLRLQKHDFLEMAHNAVLAQALRPWLIGANSTDHLAFPIPLTMDRTHVQVIIDSCMLFFVNGVCKWDDSFTFEKD
ncbi:hypothetical protein B0H17DRAFT_1128365 [Mycena rosella]|uniref:Chromo domain-containing protein n=1 Tax=Mycena rosella TaxID=1033263 RepID=A0AAD7DWR3_MYCRO|nr:hypothetical protein B0H17DRAFT_1128365 [Mycena rosella]